jgi:predicted RNA-binding Zn-ribbon protein involved in translation (DUF1610 family)
MEFAHIQHPPCPECGSERTVQTDNPTEASEAFYCPDCGRIWERFVARRTPFTPR